MSSTIDFLSGYEQEDLYFETIYRLIKEFENQADDRSRLEIAKDIIDVIDPSEYIMSKILNSIDWGFENSDISEVSDKIEMLGKLFSMELTLIKNKGIAKKIFISALERSFREYYPDIQYLEEYLKEIVYMHYLDEFAELYSDAIMKSVIINEENFYNDFEALYRSDDFDESFCDDLMYLKYGDFEIDYNSLIVITFHTRWTMRPN